MYLPVRSWYKRLLKVSLVIKNFSIDPMVTTSIKLFTSNQFFGSRSVTVLSENCSTWLKYSRSRGRGGGGGRVHNMIINFIKFSTSDTAILAFWLVHCISVTSYYTYIWPCVEINAANAKFFVGSQVSSTKKWMRKTEANSVSCLKKKHKKLRTMPSQ